MKKHNNSAPAYQDFYAKLDTVNNVVSVISGNRIFADNAAVWLAIWQAR